MNKSYPSLIGIPLFETQERQAPPMRSFMNEHKGFNAMIFSDCRASLSHTGVRHVRQTACIPARSPYQAVLLQLQRGFSSLDIQGSHGFRLLRGQRHGISCVKKGTNIFEIVLIVSINIGVY